MCITYQYDLADLGFYDLGLNLYLKNSRPASMEDAMVPPLHTKLRTLSWGGSTKIPDSKAWRHGVGPHGVWHMLSPETKIDL